jgi:predicted GTPase
MAYGAGVIAARRYSATPVDPRTHATGSIKKAFAEYPHLGKVLPAMGYSPSQLRELERTINRTECDAVISGTPMDLRKVINVRRPVARIRYDLEETSHPDLRQVLKKFLKTRK